jgi:predicted cobalt transporter CbtA
MDFTPSLLFGIAGAMAGLLASGLGLAALKHLPAATESDRVVGWTLWWWVNTKRYDSEGQRLCRRGGWVFAVGAVCWILAVYFWRH